MKCFIFDLDGVLTETSREHFLAWKELADELGITIDLEFNENLKGISRRKSLEKILEHGKMLHKFTEAEIEALLTKKNRSYLQSIKNLTKADAFNGVDELLSTLKEHHCKLALASASKNAPLIIEALEITKYFDYIVDPANIKGKPAPDIFLAASNYFQIEPHLCVGVEDSQAGIKAIKAAKMYAVGIGDKLKLNEADVVYTNILEFNQELNKLLH
jgi:beta-phosphoglucomutase